MDVFVRGALSKLGSLSDLVAATTVAEMRVAAYVLAGAVRERHPVAVEVLLEDSDQGDWLIVSGWHAGDPGVCWEVDLPDAVAAAASHLYSVHIDGDGRSGAVPALRRVTESGDGYRLCIDQALQDLTVHRPLPGWGCELGPDDSRFVSGDCDLLALTLHDLTGWPLVVVADYGEDGDLFGWVHVLVETPSGDLLDVEGAHGAEEVLERWADDCDNVEDAEIVRVEPAQVRRRRPDPDPAHTARIAEQVLAEVNAH